ncbi:hypothetical protein GCM10009119_07680 [Algoriphagus jejuensis]|uniref:Uncharacterized protein n=1 Tax=Algoriphagus jejuensis TaxID=419934 RepID=A0ABN1MWL7_9BACT
MKISKEDFQEMRAKYTAEVRQGKPAQTLTGENTNQTSWLFFNRETLEGLLAQVDKDPKVGGIQIFMAEYDEKTAKKLYPNSYELVVGSLTLVLCPANLKESKLTRVELEDGGTTYENHGEICPPHCQPDPTDV